MKKAPQKLPFYKKLLSDQGFGLGIGLIIAGLVSMCVMGILPSAVTDVAILSILPFPSCSWVWAFSTSPLSTPPARR